MPNSRSTFWVAVNRSFEVLVEAKLPSVKFDARDSCEPERRARREIGDKATFDSGMKIPWLGSHLKYLEE